MDTGFIVLEHDLYPQTVTLATEYIIPAALDFKPSMKVQNVISCLGKPLAEAYVETSKTRSAAQNLNLVTTHSTATGRVAANSTLSRSYAALPAETASATNAGIPALGADAGALILAALAAAVTLLESVL